MTVRNSAIRTRTGRSFRALESLFLSDFLEIIVHLLFVSSAEVVLEELFRLGQYPPRNQLL